MAARTRRRRAPQKDFTVDFNGDLEKMLAEMPDNYLECRDMKHAWFKRNVVTHKKEKYAEQIIGCRRCTTTKTRLISTVTGELIRADGVHRGYDYPPGYIVKGVGRLTSADNNLVRLNSILRAVR